MRDTCVPHGLWSQKGTGRERVGLPPSHILVLKRYLWNNHLLHKHRLFQIQKQAKGYTQTHVHTPSLSYTQSYTLTLTQTQHRQTHRQTHRQRDRETDIHSHKHPHTDIYHIHTHLPTCLQETRYVALNCAIVGRDFFSNSTAFINYRSSISVEIRSR